MTDSAPQPNMPPQRPTNTLPGVKQVIAVGAGKGGVGKSTVALLAAIGLARLGKKIGLLDGDVYGPSLPKLTGTEGQQPELTAEKHLVPVDVDGLKLVSLGHLMSHDQAVIWRGPMAQKYVKDMLDVTEWGDLDCLIVDLPPGTGDIPLTLAQSIPLAGALVVCTPQDVALADAVRAVRMYERLAVKPLGMVENMSYYVCPQCEHRDEIFSHGGARRAAHELGIPFLGALPLNGIIRANGDAGQPTAIFEEADPPVRAALDEFVSNLAKHLAETSRRSTPLPQLNPRS